MEQGWWGDSSGSEGVEAVLWVFGRRGSRRGSLGEGKRPPTVVMDPEHFAKGRRGVRGLCSHGWADGENGRSPMGEVASEDEKGGVAKINRNLGR